MSEPDFFPTPSSPERGIVRWLWLAFHAILFAGVVFGYPWLLDTFPEIFASNIVWMGLPVWCGLLLLHLVLVALIDVREGFIHGRRERQRRKQFESIRQESRRRYMSDRIRS